MSAWSVFFVSWLANFIFGNNGNLVHMIWWRFSQGAVLIPIGNLIFEWYTETSYSFAVPVNNSWCGNDTCTTISATVTPDNLNLMYKNVGPANNTASSLSWYWQYVTNVSDVNGNSTFWWVMISSGLEIAMMGLSYRPFSNKYNRLRDLYLFCGTPD